MLKSILTILIITSGLSASCQTTTRLNINAYYISMYFKKGGVADWEPTRKMKESFSCKELKDGNLHIKYSPLDTAVTIYQPVIGNDVIGDLSKIPKEIGGFLLKGLYFNPEEPIAFYHALYTNNKAPGGLLMVDHIELGKYIMGACYFSNGPKNPFKEKGIHFQLP